MDHPEHVPKLDGIDRAISVTPEWKGDLVNTRSDALQWLNVGGELAFSRSGQGIQDGVTGAGRKRFEILPGGF